MMVLSLTNRITGGESIRITDTLNLQNARHLFNNLINRDQNLYKIEKNTNSFKGKEESLPVIDLAREIDAEVFDNV